MKEVKSEVSFNIDKNIYPLEVIYRTAYNFTDNFFIWISNVDNTFVEVNIKPKNLNQNLNIKEKFGNDLIDFATRWSVNKETYKIREKLILTALGEIKKNA